MYRMVDNLFVYFVNAFYFDHSAAFIEQVMRKLRLEVACASLRYMSGPFFNLEVLIVSRFIAFKQALATAFNESILFD